MSAYATTTRDAAAVEAVSPINPGRMVYALAYQMARKHGMPEDRALVVAARAEHAAMLDDLVGPFDLIDVEG